MTSDIQTLIRALAAEIGQNSYPGKTAAVETILSRLIEYLPPPPASPEPASAPVSESSKPPKCPKCGEIATYQTLDGMFWCGYAHGWKPPVSLVARCSSCKGTAFYRANPGEIEFIHHCHPKDCHACGHTHQPSTPPAPAATVRRMQANHESARMWGVDNHAEEHDETKFCATDPPCVPVEPSPASEPAAEATGERRRMYIVQTALDAAKGDDMHLPDGSLTFVEMVREITPIDEARLEELLKVYWDGYSAKGWFQMASEKRGIAAVIRALNLPLAGGGK